MIAQRRRHTLGQILVWRGTRSLFFCSSQSFCDRCGRTPTTTRDRSLCGSEGFVSACTVICIVWLSHARAHTLAQDREQTNTHAQNYHTIGAAVLSSSSSCHGLRGVGCHTIIVSKYCATHRKCVHAHMAHFANATSAASRGASLSIQCECRVAMQHTTTVLSRTIFCSPTSTNTRVRIPWISIAEIG